jgi:hypothetical protein
MALRRPRRLQLQQLEDRTTPAATTRLVGGLLIIRSDNLNNNLVIAETATPGKFAVTNNATPVGQFKFSSLSVTMGNGNDTVDLRIKTAIPGNVMVLGGNGSDFVTTENSAGGAARIGGNTLVNLGRGNFLGVQAKVGELYDQAVRLFNLRFLGQSTSVIGTPGSGAELLDIENATFGGNLVITNVYQTGVSTFTGAVDPVQIGGSITVNNVQKNTDSRTLLNAQVGPGNQLALFNLVTVAGNVTYTGGNGQDAVSAPGDFGVVTPVIINGNLTFNGGEGVGLLALGTGGSGASQIAGSVRFTGGSGNDRILFDTDSSIAGDLYVNLGEGDNQFFGDSIGLPFSFSKFSPFGNASVGGDMTLLAGNGNNFLASYGDGGDLTVSGNLSVLFGNGDNTGDDPTAPGPITFFNTDMSVGGTAQYQAGTGTNDLTLTNETIGRLRLIFSGGPTTLLFNQPSGFFNGDLYIDFGVGFGPKSLGGTAAFGGTVTILNY